MKAYRTYFRQIDSYVFASLIGCSFLMIGLSFHDGKSFFEYPFLLTLNLVNFFICFHSIENYDFQNDLTIFSKYILLQTCLLIGLCFEQKNGSLVFISLIPIMHSYYKNTFTLKRLPIKNLVLVGVYIGVAFSLISIYGKIPFSAKDISMLLGFSSWIGILIACEIFRKNKIQGHINHKALRTSEIKANVSPEEQEKMFYHDLINITHGLSMFLKNRLRKQEGMEPEDCEVIYQEVKNLQSIAKDHYGYFHKNITYAHTQVDFSFIMNKIDSLIKVMFKGSMIEVDVKFSSETDQYHTYYFPAFYRIINNLFKNIVDEGVDTLTLHLTQDDSGIKLFMKNKLSIDGQESDYDLSEKLSNLILKEELPRDFNLKEEGLGLESIEHMAKSLGGTFEFKIENDHWINIVSIPAIESKKEDDESNWDDAIHKKVA